MVLDESLLGRAIAPDPDLHQLSAREGFENENIFTNARKILQAAELSLAKDPDLELLAPLKFFLEKRETPAHDMVRNFHKLASIEETLKHTYLTNTHV